jgi:hypothetical protein
VVLAASVTTQLCGKHISAAVNQHATIEEAVFSMARAARVATQRCGKHISAAVNQHATIEEAV